MTQLIHVMLILQLLDTVETMEIIGDVGINDTREHLSNATMIFNNISSRISQQVDDFGEEKYLFLAQSASFLFHCRHF